MHEYKGPPRSPPPPPSSVGALRRRRGRVGRLPARARVVRQRAEQQLRGRALGGKVREAQRHPQGLRSRALDPGAGPAPDPGHHLPAGRRRRLRRVVDPDRRLCRPAKGEVLLNRGPGWNPCGHHARAGNDGAVRMDTDIEPSQVDVSSVGTSSLTSASLSLVGGGLAQEEDAALQRLCYDSLFFPFPSPSHHPPFSLLFSSLFFFLLFFSLDRHEVSLLPFIMFVIISF